MNNSSNVIEGRARYSRNNNIVSKIDDFTIVVEDEEIMKGEKSISNKKINSKNMKDEYENSFIFPLEDKKEKDKSNTTNNNKVNESIKKEDIKDKYKNTKAIEIDDDDSSVKIKVKDDSYEENDAKDNYEENDNADYDELFERKLKEKLEKAIKKVESLQSRLNKFNERKLLGKKKKQSN